MNFILTKYIHPLKEPLIVSSKLEIVFDNPRNQEEIEMIITLLKESQLEKEKKTPIIFELSQKAETTGIYTLEHALNNFNKKYNTKDEYVGLFFQENQELNILEKLAKMWVIARYPEKRESNQLDKETNDSENNYEDLVNYSYLLSLLIHTNDEYYYGQTFLIHHSPIKYRYSIQRRIISNSISYLELMCLSESLINKEDYWLSFFHTRDKIFEISNKLDNIIDSSNKEKILYISNLLKVIGHDIKDERYKLITLVSIIELLLTHNPDYNRFNVEDSIGKQFRLKTSLLVHQFRNTFMYYIYPLNFHFIGLAR